MSVTVDLDESLVRCDSCPSVSTDGKDAAVFIDGWDHHEGLWECPCCQAERDGRDGTGARLAVAT